MPCPWLWWKKYRPRKGVATEGFQKWIDSINEKVSKTLFPTLDHHKMTLPSERYASVAGIQPGYCLAQIADFNTLITKSQEYRTPVFALSDAQLGHVGKVLETDVAKRDEFAGVFGELADRVLALTADDVAT